MSKAMPLYRYRSSARRVTRWRMDRPGEKEKNWRESKFRDERGRPSSGWPSQCGGDDE